MLALARVLTKAITLFLALRHALVETKVKHYLISK